MQDGREGFGVGMPVFLGIWLVCALIAAVVWQNLVNDTPGHLTFSALTTVVLGVAFGLPGAGLVAFAADIARRP